MVASYKNRKRAQGNNMNPLKVCGITSTRNIKSLNIGAYDK